MFACGANSEWAGGMEEEEVGEEEEEEWEASGKKASTKAKDSTVLTGTQ